MQAVQILAHPAPPGNPSNPTPHPFAGYHHGTHIALPPAQPMTPKQAGQLLAAWRDSLRTAGLALLAFQQHLERDPIREDLETSYNLIIVGNGLHTFLTPGDAADLAAAVEARRRAEGPRPEFVEGVE